MTYLELLSWARKGVAAEQDNLRRMREKASEGMASGAKGAKSLYEACMEKIDILDVKLATIAELEEIHNREYGG